VKLKYNSFLIYSSV